MASDGLQAPSCVKRPANFRDVAQGIPDLRKTRLYRCAYPVAQREFDPALFQSAATIVDLRSSNEGPPVERTTLPECMNRLTLPVFQSPSHFLRALIADMSWQQRFSALWRIICGHPLQRVARSSFSDLGLFGMNRLLLRHAQDKILAVLESALAALEKDPRSSVVLSCSAGKDRTGLFVALILACARVSTDDIARDYALSSEARLTDPEWYAEICQRMEKEGLDVSWTTCPPSVMTRTFQFIDQEFGGVRQYLCSIGFGVEKQEKFARELRVQ